MYFDDLADKGPGPMTRSEMRKFKRKHSRRLRRLLVVLAALVVAVGGVIGWIEAEAHPFGAMGRHYVVGISRGEGLDGVLSALERDGVMSTSLSFRLWSLVNGAPSVEPGHYEFFANEPFGQIAETLNQGPDVFVLHVYPGYSVREVDASLITVPGTLIRSFASAVKDEAVPSLFTHAAGPYAATSHYEGVIGVGNYYILPGETGKQLLSQMVARFAREAKKVGLSTQTSVNGYNAYSIITVASIAQKEGYYTRYLGDVARTIYNRLHLGMNLDMTSTVLYALHQDGGTVTLADEALATPYNTYKNAGLTPTPICVPSVAALKAALSPPVGSWLYFDLTTAKKGTMLFSATYKGQLAAEAQAKKNGVGQPVATTTQSSKKTK